MKVTPHNLLFLSVCAAVLGSLQPAGAAGTTTWSGGGGANQNWSAAANWTTSGGSTPPGTGDAVIFRAAGTAGSAGTIDNIVDSGFTSVVGSLLLTNDVANIFHTTQVPAGNTLAVNGLIIAGGTNQTATYTFTGGGTLLGGTGSSAFTVATGNGGTLTLDLSPLTNFVYNAGGAGGTFSVGLDPGYSSGGILKLAASNNITATTMVVGNNNSGATSTLNLGAGTNLINANTLNISFDKSIGTVQFNSSSGGLRLRNAAGTGRTTVSVCDNGHSGSSGTITIGNVSLKGHYVDMMIGTLTLANRHTRSGGSDNAYFSFDTGIVDVTNINMAINASGGTAPVGYLAVGGGTLKVANNISLVNCAGAAGTGSLVVTNGGLVTCGGSIIKTTAAGTGNVTVSGSTLTMTSAAGVIGSAVQPVDTLNLTNATLHLKLDGNNVAVPSIAATTVNTNGANTIIIDSIVNASGTVTFPLISYTGNDPFGSLSVSLPVGITGSLVDDTADQLVQLTIMAPVSAALVWVGATNSVLVSSWDTNKTKNWLDAATMSIPQVYKDPDTALFDDTASNNIVTLATTVLPANVTFNNATLSYTLNGPGKISGSAALTNLNAGTVVLADTGGDDFSGGIAVNGGTLVLDNVNSAISGGLTIASGATAQIGSNDTGGNLPSGIVDDEGMLVVSRSDNFTMPASISGGGSLVQSGGGTLTLSVSNSYTGGTVASKGTLALTGAGSIVTSSGLLVSNATFDVSALASKTTVLNDFNITNAIISVNPTNLLTPISVNTFEVDGITAQSNIINLIALPPIASYPATITLIQSVNPITLANGNFNFALGSLPAGSPAYAGSLSESADQTAVQLTLTAGPIGIRSSVTWAGMDNVTATTNWSDRLNWQLPGAPTSPDNVIFNGTGVSGDSATINNVLDASFTIASLTYNQNGASAFYVTDIPSGQTLTVSGAVTVGNLPAADGTLTPTYLTGGGTFAANGTTFTVNNFGSASSGSLATLDLSGLSYFVYNSSSGTMNIANATSGNRFGGLLRLAGVSNNVTAGTINFLYNNASNAGNGSSGFQFGAGTNVINADTFNIVGGKNSGTAQFISGAPATAGLRLRGANGNADDTSRAAVTIATRTSTGTGTTTGSLSLNGFPVDLKLSTLTIGQDTQSGGNAANGTLSFDTGIVDATTINLGNAGNAAVTGATGTINVGASATLVVGSGGLSMVNQTAGVGTGNLNVNGGGVICSNSIVKTTAAGTANISITDGTLSMMAGTIGTPAAPIDNLTFSDNGSLDTKILLHVTAGVPGMAATAISASGTTTINIGSIAGVIGTAQIPLISYNNGSSPFGGLVLGTVPAGYSGASLVDNTGNQSIDLIITSPAPLVWKGAVNNLWDTSTLNWLNGVTPAAYSDANFVQFDDTAATGTVTLATTVLSPGINVINNTLAYTFNGTGRISGTGSLVKQGSGTLILDNSATNDFSGGISIAGGTLQTGNNDANGVLPAGNIADNGTLAFFRADDLTFANAISGSGGVSQINTNTVTLSGVNSYGGATLISGGTLRMNNAGGASGNSSLGVIPGGTVTVTNGGTLDVGGNSTANQLGFTNAAGGAKQFYIAGAGVGGNGAIVNNGTVNQQNAFQYITLTADATVGGPARWDMRGNPLIAPVLDLGGHTLTKAGTNQMSMVNLTVTNGGSIIINSGIFSFETTSSNATTSITVNPGGVMGHFREAAGFFTAPITLNGGAIRDLNGTPGSTNDSPITLTANSTLDLNVGSTDLLRLNGVISESGGSFGLTKTNVGSYALAATNIYSGSTLVVQGKLILVNNGSISQSQMINVSAGATFDASQRDDGTLTLNNNQTLSGFGTVTGIVATASGSTIAPGSAATIGTLTVLGDVNLSGTNAMKLSHVSSATNDVLSASGTMMLGGTLNVSILAGPLAGGDTFTLFNAAGGISGAFAATNLPALPTGLFWITTNLANGVLSIGSTVNPNPTNITVTVSGNVLTLSWPPDYTGWILQSQTNTLGAGLSTNWSDVTGSSSSNTNIIPINPANPTVFYRLRRPF